MYPLVRFFESDVNENPTIDSFVPGRAVARFFPGMSFVLMVTTWVGSLLYGKARVAKGRAKVAAARRDVLPRSPNAVICPNCFEVLERL